MSDTLPDTHGKGKKDIVVRLVVKTAHVLTIEEKATLRGVAEKTLYLNSNKMGEEFYALLLPETNVGDVLKLPFIVPT